MDSKLNLTLLSECMLAEYEIFLIIHWPFRGQILMFYSCIITFVFVSDIISRYNIVMVAYRFFDVSKADLTYRCVIFLKNVLYYCRIIEVFMY